jgi:hypothetical protein
VRSRYKKVQWTGASLPRGETFDFGSMSGVKYQRERLCYAYYEIQ